MQTLIESTEEDRIRRVAKCFFWRRWYHYYAKGKMRHDPAYRVIARLVRESSFPILDVGCGAGIFAAYLRESRVRATIYGVDLSKKKIRIAQKNIALSYSGLEFAVQDAMTITGFTGTVIALDVLHYFSNEEQVRLLRQFAAMTALGAVLYVRNGVQGASGWRHLATTVEEAFVRSSRWITGGKWNFPQMELIEDTLQAEGMKVTAIPMWGHTPFSSYLFVAAK